MLQVLNPLCDPALDSLHYVHVSLVLRSPELDPALQVWPHQCISFGKGGFGMGMFQLGHQHGFWIAAA